MAANNKTAFFPQLKELSVAFPLTWAEATWPSSFGGLPRARELN